ncbi:MAG: DNA methylase [Proteobacteria bacterium]|nr:DNA methylase [Pseudomonadota bacterium]
MAWMKITSGRLESRYRYSAKYTYNTFPWPESTGAQRQAIETAAQAVLDARALFPNATLADLYDPLTMPPQLVRAHQALDRAVDAAYGKKSFASEAERVAFLFERYQTITSLLPAVSAKKTGKKTAQPPEA